MLKKIVRRPNAVRLLVRVVSLLAAAATLAALIVAPGAEGYVDPERYEKTFLGGPGLGIYWVYMTGPDEALDPEGKGVPGGIMGTFCTHPRMAGGGDFGFTQYKNDESVANPYLNAIIELSGMNSAYLSEMRYAIALGLTNSLMETQSAYWAYLNYRRPDLFALMETQPFEMNAANLQRWFGSKPTTSSNPTPGIMVPQPPAGLFIGDKAPLLATYNGGAIPPVLDYATQVEDDAAGPFSFAWDDSDPAWSPALAQLNYGVDGNRPPTFTVATPYVRMYTVDPNANPGAMPVGSVPLGAPFYIKYVGPAREDPTEPLPVTVSSGMPITTEVLADRFFYCYAAEYQYTVELKREPCEFSIGLPCKGKNPPPDERPGVEKAVTQWNKADPGADDDYDDMIEVPKDADALYKMTITNPPETDIVYKFGYKDLTVRPEEMGESYVRKITNAAELQALNTAPAGTKARLMNDIVLPAGTPAAPYDWPVINLNGVILDGAGYTIGGTAGATSYIDKSIFNLVENQSAIHNLRVKHLTVKYPDNLNASAGLLAARIQGAGEVRNVEIDKTCLLDLNVLQSAAAGDLKYGLIAGTVGTGGDGSSAVHILSGITLAGSVTMQTASGSGSRITTSGVAGDLHNTFLYDVVLTEDAKLSARRGDIMGIGALAAGNSSACNVAMNASFVNLGSVSNVYGIGKFLSENRIERFSIYLPFVNEAAAAPPSQFYGIGDNIDCSVTISKGQVVIPNDINVSYIVCAGTGANGNTDKTVTISEVGVEAARLSGQCAAGLATVNGNVKLNINDCYVSGPGGTTGTIHSTNAFVNYPADNRYYAAGIAAHADNSGSNITVTNCWADIGVTSASSDYNAKIAAMDGYNTYFGSVTGCYALGSAALAGAGSGYILMDRAPSARVTASGNYRTMAPPPDAPDDGPNGTYIADSLCRGAAPHMAGSGWSIGGTGAADETKTWVTAAGYPVLRDAGYRHVQVVYVHDYYEVYDPDGGRVSRVETGPTLRWDDADYDVTRDLHEYAPPWQRLSLSGSAPGGIFPQIYPNDTARPYLADAKAHIFVPAGGSYTFYARRAGLQPGTYHNLVHLTPEENRNDTWPGDDDDAWVVVKDRKAGLNVVKMLLDSDYLTTLDGCEFQLTEYDNPAFSGAGTIVGTARPVGMDGDNFGYDLKPGCTYQAEEISAPANVMPGGPWYITYTDTVRVFTDPRCRPGPAPGGDELDAGASSTESGGTTTTVYSYKAINEYGPGVKRARLRVVKCNEDGTQEVGGELIDITVPGGLQTEKRWSGALFAVLRCNRATGTDEQIFNGPNEAFGSNLMCGDPGRDTIGLPPGKYVLVELQPPVGYALDTTPYWITVDDDGMITVVDQHADLDQVNYGEPGTKQTLEAEIEIAAEDGMAFATVRARDKKPDYQLRLTKVIGEGENAGDPLPGVTFVVTGTCGPDDTPYGPVSVLTDGDGLAVIDFPQPDGTYVITETAPKEYDPIPPIHVDCIGGEMFLLGGPEGWAKGDIVVVPGGWVFSKSNTAGVDEYTRIDDDALAGMGLARLGNGVIARAHIGLKVENYPRTAAPEVTIEGRKAFDAADTAPERDFIFTIEKIEGPDCTLPSPPTATVHYPGTGEFSFTITDMEDGTYVFRITESAPGGGWTASTPPQEVTVVVSGGAVASVTYPTGGAAAGTAEPTWEHVTPSTPYSFDTDLQYRSYRYAGGGSAYSYNFEVRDNAGAARVYRGFCGNISLSAPPDGALLHWDASLDGTYSALTAALAFSDTGAKLTDEQFFDLFGMPLNDADHRFRMMQNVHWQYSAGWPASHEIGQIYAMLLAYNDSAVTGPAITSLSLDYDPETGKMTMGHVGYQSRNPHTALSWSGSVSGLTVVIDGVTYADAASPAAGVAVNKNSSINVTYTGAGSVEFSLADSQLYLKKDSIKGERLVTDYPARDQPVIIGYAAFGTLKCGLAINGGSAGEALNFTNTYSVPDRPPVTIFGVKTFLISDSDKPTDTFTFTISQVSGPACTLPAPPTAAVLYPGSGTFSFEIADLEDGTYVFRIEESPTATGSNWTARTPPQFVTVVVDDGDVAVTYPGDGPTVGFTNEYGIPFAFRKVGHGGERFGRGDAAFELYRLHCELEHDHKELVTGNPGCWALLDTQETDAGGMVLFERLGSGDHMLVETRTKRGYQIPFGQWLVHVDIGAVSPAKQITISARGGHLPPAFYEDEGEGVFVLTNFPQFTMPRAGSFSLLLFTAGGVALAGSAVALGAVSPSGRKRRRKVE